MIPAWLAFYDGLLALALALAGMAGAHWGLAAPFFGFQLFLYGFFIAILGLLFGLIALAMTSLMPSRRAARPRAVIGIILTLLIILPVVRTIAATHQYPPINDITTDTRNPLEFVVADGLTAQQVSAMKYDAAKYASAQEAAAAYKDLAPLKVDGRPDDVFKKAEIIAGEIADWQITYNDSKSRTIQGMATSSLFRFKDDFIIRVDAADANTSVVAIRSKSRDGKGDLGVNYRRIKIFFSLLKGPPRGATSGG
jgi:uncharacterized protein (DUF1499 family)